MKEDCIEIPLSRGKVALVSSSRFEEVSAMGKWSTLKGRNTYYAVKNRRGPNGKYSMLLMHRFLMGDTNGHFVDHVNGNGLDNRECNIRVSTPSQNGYNSGISAANTSGYKGVSWANKCNKWKAQIRTSGKSRHIGYFDSALDAHEAYRKAAIAERGEFARFK